MNFIEIFYIFFLAGITNSILLGRKVNVNEDGSKNTKNPRTTFDKRFYHGKTGFDVLNCPRLNKGLSFSREERDHLGLQGLLPTRISTQDEQVDLCYRNLKRVNESLDKFIYLIDLMERDERLFYKLISENIVEMLPLIYTPTVAQACLNFGLIFRRPRGLYISINDRGQIYDIVKNWPIRDIKAICVTDGERILGLGDLGTYGMGIPISKLALYTVFAGVRPEYTLPVCLDVGTNTQKLLDDPLYDGLRQKRVTGQEYDDFVEEFLVAVIKRFGEDTLIHFEDFGNNNAFGLLDKYREQYTSFNDDIQGTGAVTLSGIYASTRITKIPLKDYKFLFMGAGEAGLGISNILVSALVESGVTREEAISQIYLTDSKGLLVNSREDLGARKRVYAKDMNQNSNFTAIVEAIKPNMIIGVATQPGSFTKEIIEMMSKFHDRPVIFALSNPTSKSECTAEEAYKYSHGRAVFASGSPFKPVEYEGKKFVSGLCNNAYIFPSVAMGILASGIERVTDDIYLLSAQSLSDQVTDADLETGLVYPPMKDMRKITLTMAKLLVEYAYKNSIATKFPEPKDKEKFIRDQQYDYNY